MASALVWQLIKDNNSFLVKRGRTHRSGAVQLSAEPGNLLNVNSAKYSGLATSGSVHVANDLTVTVKDSKNANKPKTQAVSVKAINNKKVAAAASGVRGDLARAAVLRHRKISRAIAIRKGVSKKAVKSTRRN